MAQVELVMQQVSEVEAARREQAGEDAGSCSRENLKRKCYCESQESVCTQADMCACTHGSLELQNVAASKHAR